MKRGPVPGDRALEGATFACAATVLATLVLVVGSVVARGIPALSVRFVLGSPAADPADGGLLPVVVGTFACTMLMTLVCVPFGVATAVWLTEIAARGRTVTMVRASIRNLAAVPSVVFGLFGLGFFVLFVGRHVDDLAFGPGSAPVFARPSLLWSSATLAVLTLPVVVVTTEEALRAIPRDVREAAYALGATRIDVVFRVLLPHARSGILTGVILAVARGTGEVAPLLFTGVVAWQLGPPTGVRDGFMHLGHHVYVLATQAPDIETARPALFATAIVLLTLTFTLNLAAVALRRRGRQVAR